MQEHTNKDTEVRGRSTNPIHIVPTSRQAGASAEALREVHMSLVRAEQNLYNLVQASHATGQPAFGFSAPAFAPGGYAAPAFPPGFAPSTAIGTPTAVGYGFPGQVNPWSQSAAINPWAQASTGVIPAWNPLAASIAALPGTLGAGLPIGYPAFAGRVPACDISDEGKSFVCLVDLPGVRADQVEVLATEHSFVINASRETETDTASLVQAERPTSLVQRTILLPNEVQPGGVKATLSNGILTVTLPKVHPTEGPRRIKVQG